MVQMDRSIKTSPGAVKQRKPRGSGHERRDEILVAAKALFLQHGVERVSTRQIAERVGISQTALYVYFDNRGAILDALSELAFGKLGTVVDTIERVADGPLDYLQKLLPAYMRFGLDHPDEYRLAFLLVDPTEPVPVNRVGFKIEAGSRIYASMERQVFEAVRVGAIGAGLRDPRAIAQSVWAAMHGLVAVRLAFPAYQWVEADTQIRVHTKMLMDGLVGTAVEDNGSQGASAPTRHA